MREFTFSRTVLLLIIFASFMLGVAFGTVIGEWAVFRPHH